MSVGDELRARLLNRSEAAEGERGASFVEYALLLALIVLVCLAAMTTLGQDTSAFYKDTADKVALAN